jgi:AGZA family xanthine/uracil permease-like MFS transporter
MVALGLILATLTARWQLPFQIPGALGAVAIGGLIYYGMYILGWGSGPGSEGGVPESVFRAALPFPMQDWLGWITGSAPDVIRYLPVAIPLALATVVGGIDCTESAASVGDEYSTGQIIAAEGLATLVGGIAGGVIQSTPYIGHPAYKAMGARSAYTLATALFVGAAGIFGFFDWIFFLVPKAVIFPILIFVGLEITSQSFHATPVRHYPAVALACVPALAYLAVLAYKQLAPELKPFGELQPGTQHWIQTVTVLAGGGGFIVTSLLWATALVHIIDGRIRSVVATLLIAAVFSLFGVIHSPLQSSPIKLPAAVVEQLKAEGRAAVASQQTPYHWAGAYVLTAVALVILARFGTVPVHPASETLYPPSSAGPTG